MTSIHFANTTPEEYALRQGDIIGVRFIPVTGTKLEEWCNASIKALQEIAESNPMETLYQAMRDYRTKHGTIDLAYGEKTGHTHTILPGDFAVGYKLNQETTGPSKGINVSPMSLKVLDEMDFPTHPSGKKVKVDSTLFTDITLVAAIKPFGIYHVNALNRSTTTFDVESLTEADIADHKPILCASGFWLYATQATVDIHQNLQRVAD